MPTTLDSAQEKTSVEQRKVVVWASRALPLPAVEPTCHCGGMATLWIDLIALIAFSLVLWAPGLAMERLWPTARFGVMRPLAQATAGVAVWFGATLLLATTGSFNQSTIKLHAAVVVMAGLAASWWRLRRHTPAKDATVAAPPKVAPWQAALLVLLWLPHLVRATSPVVSWDAATYHLTLPRRLLEEGGFPAVEWLFYGAWPQLVETLYGAAMAVRDHVLAKGLHAMFGGLWLATLVLTGAAWRARWAGVAAALAVLASPVVAYELPIAYVDLAQAGFLLLAFSFGQRACSADDRRQALAALLMAGVAAGLLAGSKLIGVGQAGIVGIGLLWQVHRGQANHLKPQDVIVRFGVIAIAMWLPWPIRSALETGNPVFPLLTSWFGGPHWNPTLGTQLSDWHASIGMGRGAVDWLLLPWRVATQGGPEYGHFAGDIGAHWLGCGALAILAAVKPGPHRDLARRSLALAAALFVMWALTSQQARLLLPALGPLGLAAGLGAEGLLTRVPDLRHRRLVGGLALLVMAATLVAWPQRAAWREARALAELKAEHGGRLTLMAMPRVARFVASRVPADATLLMLHTNQAFWIGRDVIADSTFEASQISAWIGATATPASVAAKLRRAGVSHILSAPPRWPGAAALYPAALTAFAANPKTCLPLFRDPEHRVCAVVSSP